MILSVHFSDNACIVILQYNFKCRTFTCKSRLWDCYFCFCKRSEYVYYYLSVRILTYLYFDCLGKRDNNIRTQSLCWSPHSCYLNHCYRLFWRVSPNVQTFFLSVVKIERWVVHERGMHSGGSWEVLTFVKKQECTIRCSHLPLLVHTHACNMHHCPQRILLVFL